MTENSKVILVIVGACLLFLGWWLSDIPIGYYQFKRICEKEGGLRVYGKVAPNVGWSAAHEIDAKAIVQSYPNVPFARFRSDEGTWKDVRYKGGYGAFSAYDVSPADETKKPRYRRIEKVERVEGAIRLRKNVVTVLDETSDQVVFQSTRFIFTWTNPESTLLGRSDSVECPSYRQEATAIQNILKTKE